MYSQEHINFTNQLLERNNFYVKVNQFKIEENIVQLMVNYLEEYRDDYVIDREGYIIVNKENIIINKSLVRLYFVLDIFKNMRVSKLPLTILQVYKLSGEKTTSLEDLFYQFPPEDIEKENYIALLIRQISNDKKLINSFDKELKEKGLYHSFNILKGFII